MNWKFAVGALAFALRGATAASGQAPASAKPPVAKEEPKTVRAEGVAAIVNDEVVSTFDVNQRIGLMLYLAGIQPSQEYIEQLRVAALRALVDEHLQLQEAKRLKIKVSDDDVKDTLNDFAQGRRKTMDGVKRELMSMGVNPATLELQARASVAWRRLVNGFYGSRIRVSQAQVTETLARYVADASKPQYLLSVIELPAESAAETEDARKVAASILDALQRGADFGRVAMQVSGAPTAAAGGDMGWLTKEQIKPTVLQAEVDRMQPGQVAGPFAASGGLYIIALRSKRDGVDTKASTKVSLKQIAAASAQKPALDKLRRKINGCKGVEAAVAGTDFAVQDLGEVQEDQLADDLAKIVSATSVGGASDVFEADGKAKTVVVCSREAANAAGLPSRAQVENKLVEDELSMLSDRYLRNLYRDATVMTPMLKR
jgi:peptidyl-prolyl cis-trans isomerase SurA